MWFSHLPHCSERSSRPLTSTDSSADICINTGEQADEFLQSVREKKTHF